MTKATASGKEPENHEAVMYEGIVPPHFAASELDFTVEGDQVHLWAASKLTNPFTPGSPAIITPVLVLTVPARAFDATCLKRTVRVAEKIADGHAAAAVAAA